MPPAIAYVPEAELARQLLDTIRDAGANGASAEDIFVSRIHIDWPTHLLVQTLQTLVEAAALIRSWDGVTTTYRLTPIRPFSIWIEEPNGSWLIWEIKRSEAALERQVLDELLYLSGPIPDHNDPGPGVSFADIRARLPHYTHLHLVNLLLRLVRQGLALHYNYNGNPDRWRSL